MPVLTLEITIPAAHLTRAQTAARDKFGQVPDGVGGMRDRTNAEIVEAIRQEVISRLKQMVIQYERKVQAAAVEAAIPDLDAT